jgi:hypothetical protein
MIDIDDTLARGGASRMALLRYCVLSMTLEPVFLLCASEYRLRPAHANALAIYDVFCAPNAPARLAAYELLPPRELTVAAAIERIRQQWKVLQAPPPAEDEEERTVATTPGRELFDGLVRGVRADTHGRLGAVSASFDPLLSAEENLPGGKLNGSQRQFVDRVWQPIVRPRLTAAGFWQLATIA